MKKEDVNIIVRDSNKDLIQLHLNWKVNVYLMIKDDTPKESYYFKNAA